MCSHICSCYDKDTNMVRNVSNLDAVVRHIEASQFDEFQVFIAQRGDVIVTQWQHFKIGKCSERILSELLKGGESWTNYKEALLTSILFELRRRVRRLGKRISEGKSTRVREVPEISKNLLEDVIGRAKSSGDLSISHGFSPPKGGNGVKWNGNWNILEVLHEGKVLDTGNVASSQCHIQNGYWIGRREIEKGIVKCRSVQRCAEEWWDWNEAYFLIFYSLFSIYISHRRNQKSSSLFCYKSGLSRC